MSPDSEYQEPPWAKAPSGVWSLREIKGGVQIAQHVLDRPCVLLGRASDLVHIVLQHESSSRQHARIAFDQTGTPWLRDLSSSHGTTVNRKRMPPAAVGRSESLSRKAGSRGVTLYPGDILQFGASTRMFCLKGPTEFERGAVSAKAAATTAMLHSESVETFKHSNNNNKQAVDNHDEPEGITWGIDMGDNETDTDDTRHDETSLKLPLDIEDQLDDKHRKEFERLRALKYKLENLQTESDRIRRKGELSEGQERQLQRNEEREGKFREEIEEKETELHRKVFPGKRKAGHASREKESYGGEDDVDDFYDRTKERGPTQGIDEGETEQSLTSKWKTDHELIEAARVELEDAKLKAFKIERRLETLQATGDEEAFFVQNDLDLAKETIEKIKHETTRLQKEKEESKRLLKIVNPKLKIDESTGDIASEGGTDGFAMPPPTMKAPAMIQPPSSDSDSFMPPPKRMRVGPDDPKHISPGPSFQPSSDEKSKLKTAPGPPRGTLSIIFSETKGPTANTVPVSRKDSKEKETINFTVPESREETKEEQIAINSDPQVDVWQAPKDQDGSGITKLNAKFAGRY
jgi:pSer/pThr/pTyr-binding forkhead associated (FHA) protein